MASSGPHSDPIGETLRRRRVETLGKGLREMAALLGVAPAHLTDIEKGRRGPSEELMQRIAQHYDLPIAQLRAGWAKPEAIVKEIASQDSTTAAKVPEFLRTARHLTPQQWDALIHQADRMASSNRPRRQS